MYNTTDFLQVKQDFEIYYNNEIKHKLEKLENTRRKYLKIFILLCVFVALWCIYLFINFEYFMNLPCGIELASCIGILIVCIPMFSYRLKTKSSILHLFANFFGEFRYIYNDMLYDNILSKSLIADTHNIMIPDDGFSGEYKGVAVNLREYSLFEKNNNLDRAYTKTYTHNPLTNHKKMYRGIIFYAQMNKKFKGQTIIVKDNGFLNRFTTYKKLNRVSLESTEFEKKFEVYSDDQVEARYLLTTVMLEYLVELRNKFKQIELSFFDNHVLINIKTKRNMFECNSFFTTLINKKRINKTLEELYLLFSIVDTLRINQNKNY